MQRLHEQVALAALRRAAQQHMGDVGKMEERRRLVDSFVNSVTVFDEYILITFNYREEETTVPFSNIDSSDLSSVGELCRVSL